MKLAFAIGFGLLCAALVWLASRREKDQWMRSCVCSAAAFVGGVVACYALLAAASPWVTVLISLVSYFLLCLAALTDLRTHTIPNVIPLAFICLKIVLFLIELAIGEFSIVMLANSLIGMIVAFSLFAISARISKGGIGSGDTKIVSAIGLACGLSFVLSITVFALILCVVVGVGLLLLKKADRKSALPFAPFLWGGFVLVMALNLL